MRDPVLQINRVPYSIAEEEAVELILAADSGAISKGELTAFLHKHLKIPGN